MSITHPIGLSQSVNRSIVGAMLLASILGLGALIVLNGYARYSSNGLNSIVYGVSLFICSLCSYLYTIRWAALPTPLLRRLDHAAIFFSGRRNIHAVRLGPYPRAVWHSTSLLGMGDSLRRRCAACHFTD